MIKILLYGVMPENNFGGPSLMHGAKEIIKELHDNYEIVFYQSTKPVDIAVKDMGFKVYQIPYKKTSKFLIDAYKLKLGLRPKSEEHLTFLNNIRNSDIVVNLYGICFCSNFDSGKNSYFKAIKSTVGKFSVSYVAKIFGVKTAKATASYGPIISKNDVVAAKFSANHIFDIMYARENESKRQLELVSGREIPTSPDLANLMNYDVSKQKGKYIGISISHQIIRQWKSSETYINCIVKLIEHIISETDYKVLLIPNEITNGTKYHDVHVAKDILNLLDNLVDVKIVDSKNMTSTQLKNTISQCEVLNACVAALSAGVPTLVIGWHHKYDELLKWYGQNKWILSSENCTPEKLISMFDSFLEVQDNERIVIKENYANVRSSLLEAGKSMFTI